ncbi:MarR family winged helix-turn-helix transcriptional regulator [Niallia sp. 01092]|uniref:MarR family winged helix-turn-helix transcriptional regulator n=1 Tax=unclassified Niallia TaxID=2837522 RepID=UPI003FCF1D8C
MDKKDFFQKFIVFTTSVHQVTHELTKNAKLDTVTPVQFNILKYIYVNQPVTISEISDCQHMSMPNTSRELKKLSEKKLIEKLEDMEDRRKQFIRLSNNGKTMMNEAFKYVETGFLNRIQDASKEELEEMDRALEILHKKLFY